MALNFRLLKKPCFEQVEPATHRATMSTTELISEIREMLDPPVNEAFTDENVEDMLRQWVNEGKVENNFSLLIASADCLDRVHRLTEAGEDVPEDVRNPKVMQRIKNQAGRGDNLGSTTPF